MHKTMFLSLFGALSILSFPSYAQQAAGSEGASKTQSIQTADTGWQVICRSAAADRSKLGCSIVYETYSANDRVRLASVEIVKGEKSRVMVISAPIGVNLKDGLDVQVDGLKLSQIAFTHCLNNGCFASLDLTDTMVSTLKKGKVLSLAISDMQGAKIKSDISMVGFVPALTKAEDK